MSDPFTSWGKPRTRINPVSKKRAKENRKRRPILEALRGGPCAARLPMCTGVAVDGHELLSRAQGGSTTDRENVRGVCRLCHDFITTHPAWAYEHGWAKHAWQR